MDKFLLEMKNIIKEFSGVRALDNVSLSVKEGEIHALCGENGAGKSTLMNVLSGVIPHGEYEGEILFDGNPVSFKNIRDSEKQGIVIIHQELAMIPYFSIAENMFLGNERGTKFNIDWDKTNKDAADKLKVVGLNESPYTLVKDIGVGKQQLCEIAKALSKEVRLLILDEPTASLNENDSRNLLDLLLSLKKQGVTSIIISHKINELSYVADVVTVIRDGCTIETIRKDSPDFNEDRIIKDMVGRELKNRYPLYEARTPGEPVLELIDWTVHHPLYRERKVVDNASITVRRGEVVGIAGLIGAGRTELAMSAFGKSYGAGITGTIKISGAVKKLNTVSEAIDSGLAYVTEDRKGNGLILSESIAVNTTMAKMSKVSHRGVIDKDKELEVAETYRKLLRTKANSVSEPVVSLSGGNQQKVLLSKWMFADPDILILDEPTRGIDVGAKYEIYLSINELIKDGKSVLIISSDMSELLGVADRIYVMNAGRIVGELPRKEATQEKIMAMIIKSDSEKSSTT
ncbi:MAG: sugar ABC transporter ATP-binding protein [Ruminococcus sp.]|jgi:putative multiple sugar transport system ATP-binding protein|nr:sugar ABC transporter ATP-binding protein [Ruminococcus sp.]